MRRCVAVSLLLGLAACSSSDEGSSAAGASPAPLPLLSTDPAPLVNGVIPMAADDGSPLAAGVWQIGDSATGVDAIFVSPQGKGLLTVTCDTASRVLRLGVSSARPGNQSFVLESGGTAARLDTLADGNAADPHQSAAIARQSPVFEGFVHEGGTIEISQPGGATLRLPSHSGIRRVFEACQQ